MYLISYDISENKLRTKVAKKLEDYGRRVQYSVFECRLDKKRFKRLYGELAELTAEMDGGSIRIYSLDKAAEESLTIIGDSEYSGLKPEEEVIFI